MLAQDILTFRNELQKRNTLFAYSGYLSEALLFSLGGTVKQQLEIKNTESKTVRRVFSVFVEQVQNVIRYSDEKEWHTDDKRDRQSAGVIAVGIEDTRFFVICGNTVKQSEAPKLEARLNEIVSMDEPELRQHYKQKLREEPEEQSEGGTIGLLEIARRASAPLQFEFMTLDEERQFFVLKAYI
ncbi:hypothetical protein JM93_00150 [Roseibium hamelinense]|uniref:Uncharacterized protein n=1 Tax=Roseibium hamelinense TaxID=150831 RepID=A0A562THG8_9HYPH|nr:SiaB family protein kinase [Roseibium hamelinense]MTI42403.1 hypothetical protein [Roseibium hamelinense]TWI92608.1 hypothetical protein JM93_00150 [Roseibium hamelinense]